MLGTRILVILSEFSKLDSLADTVLGALSSAARPFGVRFALPMGSEEIIAQLPTEAVGNVAAHTSALFYREGQDLEGVLPLLTDETHFLSLKGPHLFAQRWDQQLLTRHRRVDGLKPALLTAMVSQQDAEMPPQAFLPALEDVFTGDAVKIGRGLSLVCAAAPVRTMIINPTLFFGKLEYIRQAETRSAFLSIAAFVAGFHVYAVETPLVWPAERPGMRWLQNPEKDMLPRVQLARFEQSAGFSFGKRRVGVRSTLGLYTTEEGYPQRMPPWLEAKQRAMAALARVTRPMPMFVTAYCELPEALKPALLYMTRFSYLKALVNLPLLLYAGGRQERFLRMNFPNTSSYPDNALLPKSLLQEGMTATQHFMRNKILLLQRSMKAYPEFTHYAWVDFDILDHPVPPQAMPDYTRLMDETVHLAMVDGEPDGSMLVAPRQHMKLLAREVYALSQVDAAIKRSFSQSAMLRRLIEKFPDLFTLHPMPRKHLLFWTGLKPEFQSVETREKVKSAMPAARGRLPEKEERRGRVDE